MHERVLIADDDSVVRRVIGASLKSAGFEVCAEVEEAEAAIALAAEARPDLCLLDVYMPGSGIHAAEEISRRVPQTKVVMLTSSARDQDLLDALGAGARGYLPKKLDVEQLREVLDKVLQGEVVMPPDLVAKAIRTGADERGRVVSLPDGRRVELTSWELSLLDMLIDGRTHGEIADRHSVAGSQVEEDVSALLARLEVQDARGAIPLLVRG